ncbi:hypothetical protein H072_2235 [Dactylellina haptotyla CBS 200.50]|uniref:Uncharacterized protein n=1 Tax=Dactylellina haptotyla (strain CBS 200.50) TaxID=1284197 RepID=S8AS23_DACHA|nr:hypothetical protein H072_2235 [Dactylellina haptotyla CBS 200.50]
MPLAIQNIITKASPPRYTPNDPNCSIQWCDPRSGIQVAVCGPGARTVDLAPLEVTIRMGYLQLALSNSPNSNVKCNWTTGAASGDFYTGHIQHVGGGRNESWYLDLRKETCSNDRWSIPHEQGQGLGNPTLSPPIVDLNTTYDTKFPYVRWTCALGARTYFAEDEVLTWKNLDQVSQLMLSGLLEPFWDYSTHLWNGCRQHYCEPSSRVLVSLCGKESLERSDKSYVAYVLSKAVLRLTDPAEDESLCYSLVESDNVVFIVDTQQTSCEDEGGTSEWSFIPADPPRPKVQAKPNAFIFPENFDFFTLETMNGDYVDIEDPDDPQAAAGPFVTGGGGHLESPVRTIWTTSHAKRRPKELEGTVTPGDNFQFVGTADKALQHLKLQGFPTDRSSTAKFWLGYSANPDSDHLILLTIEADPDEEDGGDQPWYSSHTETTNNANSGEPVIETTITEGTSPDGSDERIVTQTKVDDNSGPGFDQHIVTQVQVSSPDDYERQQLFSSAEKLGDVDYDYARPIGGADDFIQDGQLFNQDGIDLEDIAAGSASVDDYFNKLINIGEQMLQGEGKDVYADDEASSKPPGLSPENAQPGSGGLGIGEHQRPTSEMLRSMLGLSSGPKTGENNLYATPEASPEVEVDEQVEFSVDIDAIPNDTPIMWTPGREASDKGMNAPMTMGSFADLAADDAPTEEIVTDTVTQKVVQDPVPKPARAKLKLSSNPYNDPGPPEESKADTTVSTTVDEEVWTDVKRPKKGPKKKKPKKVVPGEPADWWEAQAQSNQRINTGYQGRGYRPGVVWGPKSNHFSTECSSKHF